MTENVKRGCVDVSGSRLQAARGFGCGISENRRTRSSRRTVSDGRGGIREATVEIYGKELEYKRKRRSSFRKTAIAGTEVFTDRQTEGRSKGNFFGARLEAVCNDSDELIEIPRKIAVYIKYAHLTVRTFNSRLIRKSMEV